MTASAALLLLVAAGATPATALECPAVAGEALVHIDIFDGPPEEQADLAPDRTTRQGAATSNFWQLSPGARGLFVKCDYGKALAGPYSRVELIKLPDSAKSCRADFMTGPGAGDLTLQKFSCR